MRSALKLTAAAVLAAGSLSLSTAASAALCTSTTTIAGFAALGSCDSTDKTFTWIRNSSNLDAVGLAIFADDPTEQHFFSVIPGLNALTAGTYTLAYTIGVNATAPAGKYIDRVSISQDVPQATPGVSFTKVVDLNDALDGVGEFTLVAVNSAQVLVDLPGTPTKLWIYETVVVTGQGSVNSFTDGYTQNKSIPEPGTLALLGLGLAGLGFARRRKG